MKQTPKGPPVSAALVIKNGRVHAVGPRPIQHRRVAVLAVTLALGALASTLVPSSAQSHSATPTAVTAPLETQAPLRGALGAWGMDWNQFEQGLRERGFSPAQALLASTLTDRLNGVLVIGPQAEQEPSVHAGLVARQALASQLQQSLETPESLLGFAKGLQAQVQRLEARSGRDIEGFDGVGFLATLGWTEDDALQVRGLIEQAQQPTSEGGLSWEGLRSLRQQEGEEIGTVLGTVNPSATWEQAQRALERAVATTGLGQLRVSSALLQSPAQANALAEHLLLLQKDMEATLGVSGPVLGLGGRVKLDLSRPLELGTHGQVVAGKESVAMRTTLYALPHEHFHALSALVGSQDPQGEQRMDALLSDLAAAVPSEQRQALAAEDRQRFEQYLINLGVSEGTRQLLGQAQDQEGQWETLYTALTQREGLYEQDARMALMMAMALSPHYESLNGGLPRWTSLRQSVGIYLQASSDLETSLAGQYTGSEEEILAAAYASQFNPKWTQVPSVKLGIMDAPGPREAELQANSWQHFAQKTQALWNHPKQWREARRGQPQEHAVSSLAVVRARP